MTDVENKAKAARDSGICSDEQDWEVAPSRDDYCSECQRVIDIPDSNICSDCYKRIVRG